MSETAPIPKQIATLERMTVGQLQRRYAEVFGETARSGNKQSLVRRIARRIQARAEGALATRAIERARALARELARDADLRLRPAAVPPRKLRIGAATTHLAAPRDRRLPPPGGVIVPKFIGQDHHVKVLPVGLQQEGGHYKSLRAVAKAIIGKHWNGSLFFGLSAARCRPACPGGFKFCSHKVY
jgi:hypothetical protein